MTGAACLPVQRKGSAEASFPKAEAGGMLAGLYATHCFDARWVWQIVWFMSGVLE